MTEGQAGLPTIWEATLNLSSVAFLTELSTYQLQVPGELIQKNPQDHKVHCPAGSSASEETVTSR